MRERGIHPAQPQQEAPRHVSNASVLFSVLLFRLLNDEPHLRIEMSLSLPCHIRRTSAGYSINRLVCLTATASFSRHRPIVPGCRVWRTERWPRRAPCCERTERADSGSLRKRRVAAAVAAATTPRQHDGRRLHDDDRRRAPYVPSHVRANFTQTGKG